MKSWSLVLSTNVLLACGPPQRAEVDARPAPSEDAAAADAAGVTQDAPPADASLACGQILATFRDFRTTHPDMEDGVGTDTGIVGPMLGLDHKPVYVGAGPTLTVSSPNSFSQWYRDVANVNTAVQQVLPLVENPPGTFTYDNQSFFPLDGIAFGNEGNPHNYHFTTEIHTTFTYHGGETFQFSGDDDVFVFVNKRLAIDLGGVHDQLTGTIDFDARAAELGLTVGGTYQFDVFHAERHRVSSTFRMTTTIDCFVIL